MTTNFAIPIATSPLLARERERQLPIALDQLRINVTKNGDTAFTVAATDTRTYLKYGGNFDQTALVKVSKSDVSL